MTNQIQTIALDKLVEHPGNANSMSDAVFGKLVRNIERTGRYEPLVVRPHNSKPGGYEILNGHHRVKALAKLGYESADAVVWDVDDEQADILLATLNRLCGSDMLGKRTAILKRLSKRLSSGELSKLLPETASQIEKLLTLKLPDVTMSADVNSFAEPLVFFVTGEQAETIENAINSTGGFAEGPDCGATKTQRRAAAITAIAKNFIETKANA
ncbi:MAG: ParB/RepB/Spo0J family partition protein [Planctomycetota bacterium]|jgi:ParB/RepB/Spo0J family partition protein